MKWVQIVPVDYVGKDLWKRNVLKLEWKSKGVTDGKRGEGKTLG